MTLLGDADPSPILSPHPMAWPGVVVIVIVAIFVLAALVGPIIRANLDEENEASADEELPP